MKVTASGVCLVSSVKNFLDPTPIVSITYETYSVYAMKMFKLKNIRVRTVFTALLKIHGPWINTVLHAAILSSIVNENIKKETSTWYHTGK